MAIPVCTSSKIKMISFLSQISLNCMKNSLRKWLPPPSAWIGSKIKQAISFGLLAIAFPISWIACFSNSMVAATDSSVNGKVNFGLLILGQLNFGKYMYFLGSLVLVNERV